MKKGIQKFNSCEGKTSYSSLSDASEAASRLNVKSKQRVEAYKCFYCDGFHFGHTKKKKELKAVAKVKRDKQKLNPNDFEYKAPFKQKELIIRISA